MVGDCVEQVEKPRPYKLKITRITPGKNFAMTVSTDGSDLMHYIRIDRLRKVADVTDDEAAAAAAHRAALQEREQEQPLG